MTTAFHTEPSDVQVHHTGWFDLPSGGAMTKLPLWDRQHDIAARVGHAEAASWLAGMGARLPSKAQHDELRKYSTRVDPVTLPTGSMVKAAAIPTPYVDRDGRDTPAMAKYRADNMRTIEWCKLHDGRVFEALIEALWDGEPPVANFGKHWISPVGTIYGWDDIQAPSRFHAAEGKYTDYATLVHAYSPGGPAFRWSQGLDLPALTIGERSTAWLGFQSQLGIKEIAGSNHNEHILSYSRHCRRGGEFKGVDKWGNALWVGGFSLSLSRDEDPWCAAAASESLRCSMLKGEHAPHGLRVSVRELVEDARIARTLIDRVQDPRAGWLAIMGRRGETPLKGGRGHVRTVVSWSTDDYLGIGGNENNQFGRAEHARSKVEAWIAR